MVCWASPGPVGAAVAGAASPITAAANPLTAAAANPNFFIFTFRDIDDTDPDGNRRYKAREVPPVDLAKLRWRIERDYQELKQEVGLGHYEGRGWRGFHHHATMCIAAYGFLASERETIPPSGPRSAAPVQVPPLPDNYRPRGSALAA